jgi:hypothetical protein
MTSNNGGLAHRDPRQLEHQSHPRKLDVCRTSIVRNSEALAVCRTLSAPKNRFRFSDLIWATNEQHNRKITAYRAGHHGVLNCGRCWTTKMVIASPIWFPKASRRSGAALGVVSRTAIGASGRTQTGRMKTELRCVPIAADVRFGS